MTPPRLGGVDDETWLWKARTTSVRPPGSWYNWPSGLPDRKARVGL